MLPQEAAVEVAVLIQALWEEMGVVVRAPPPRLKQGVMEQAVEGVDKVADQGAPADLEEAAAEQGSQQGVRATILEGVVEV